MSCARFASVGFKVLGFGVPLALACGEPPKSDFYSPGSGSSSGGGATAAIATIGVSSTSNTSNASSNTSSSNTSSSSTGGTSIGSTSATSGVTNATTSTASSGAGGTSAGSTSTDGGSSTGGMNASCAGLPEWDGGNPEFTLDEGDEMQYNGRRYRATEPIEFPNAECAPDIAMDWCAGWFEDLGPCA